MKLKMEEKVVPELTGADNYRAWKQGVQVLLDIYELNYLLTAPEPISITPTTPEQQAEGSGSGGALNVSSAPKGKGKSGDEEEVITKERWERESKQLVSQLSIRTSSLYKSTFINLTPKNLPFLYQTLDAMFIVIDPTRKMNKKREIEAIRIHNDKHFHEHLIKWEEKLLEGLGSQGGITMVYEIQVFTVRTMNKLTYTAVHTHAQRTA